MLAGLLWSGALLAGGSAATSQRCKCAPEDTCWPSIADWSSLNATVSGKLIANVPVAQPCYPGPSYDQVRCAEVQMQWYSSLWESEQPLGMDFPLNITCPPVDITTINNTGSCNIGRGSAYAINVTTVDDIAAALAFAQDKSLRVAVKSTGHDVLGRNDGYGSLEVWLRYFRNGITFQPAFSSSTGCTSCGWTGAALRVSGAYMFREVYPVARANNVIIVGGGSPTVCSTGGWMQGGGHGPASHAFGLGADQVLEVEVVLANGTLVTANACQNQDLYFAIRGGGPSTYGIVVSSTIKAHPQVNVTVHNLQLAPRTDNTTAFLDALASLHLAVPDLVDAGYAGYAHWQVDGPSQIFDNFTTGYYHGIWLLNQTREQAVSSFSPLSHALAQYKDVLFINETYADYADYWSFYYENSGQETTVGLMAGSGSRLFDKESLSDPTAVRNLVEVLAGKTGEHVINTLSIVAGGQVSKDAADPNSGVLPAWRTAYLHASTGRIFTAATPEADRETILYDVTYNKVAAMKALAPNTGAYMNEADPYDPDFEVDFYGANYPKLRSIKAKYDPADLFYCRTCVGSSEWREVGTGTSGSLCLVGFSAVRL
ncbi:FAD/FMN-containing protein [Thozetella sp. PMI_491]|nr:FAD/FMN-containing protein [Thozetella sp. PMI_491]